MVSAVDGNSFRDVGHMTDQQNQVRGSQTWIGSCRAIRTGGTCTTRCQLPKRRGLEELKCEVSEIRKGKAGCGGGRGSSDPCATAWALCHQVRVRTPHADRQISLAVKGGGVGDRCVQIQEAVVCAVEAEA